MNESSNASWRSLRLAIAWTIIAVSVAMIAFHARQSALKRHDSPMASELQLETEARYALGMKLMLPNAPVAPLESQMRSLAQEPIEKFLLIPVDGELKNTDAAAQEADALLAEKLPDKLCHDTQVLAGLYHHGILDPADAQELQDRYGFFGKLAAARLQPADAPLSMEIDRICRRSFVGTLIFIVLAIAAFVAGIALMVVVAVQFFSQRLPPHLRRAPIPVADVLLESFALYLLSMLGLMLTFSHFQLASLLWQGLLIVPVLLALGWAMWQIESVSAFKEAVGWSRGSGTLKEMGAGLLGYTSGIPIIAIGFLITAQLSKLAGGTPGHPVVDHPVVYELQTPGATRVFLFFLACIFAPITEELLFRGMLLGHLRGRWSWIVSASIVSLIFAGIHPQGWAGVPLLFSLAMVLAGIREQRGSLIASMTAHALNNAIALAFFLVVLG